MVSSDYNNLICDSFFHFPSQHYGSNNSESIVTAMQGANLSGLQIFIFALGDKNPWGGGYSGVKRIGMTVGNPRKLP